MAKKKDLKKKVKKTKGKAGRPKKTLDYKLIDQALDLCCTNEEIASLVGCDVKTLKRRVAEEKKMDYSQYFDLRREMGKMSLRRTQRKLSLRNANMAIFLGKQHLGQSDKVDMNSKVSFQKMGTVKKDDGEDMHFDVGEPVDTSKDT